MREEEKDSAFKAVIDSWRWGWGERRGVAGDKGRGANLGSGGGLPGGCVNDFSLFLTAVSGVGL